MEETNTPQPGRGNARKVRDTDAPAGYRWVYGNLEPIPAPITEPAPWETLDINDPREHPYNTAEMPAGTKYQLFSPDGMHLLDFNMQILNFETQAAALKELVNWCKRYKFQAGYRTCQGEFIPYNDLFYYCSLESFPAEDIDISSFDSWKD